jgi:microcystin degradation protein MlrC
MPRIAVVGIATETSTFTRDRSPLERFSLTRGDEVFRMYDWDTRFPDLADIEFVPGLVATVNAGGPVDPEAYDVLESEIMDWLVAEGPWDGVYLHMHGAMAVEGRDAAEERFVGRVRDIVGPDVVLSMSMDPHGNLSRELASLVDLAAAHRQAPHVDRWDTRERSVRNLVHVLRAGRGMPVKAWVRVPLLLPGERTSTVVEPGRTVFGRMIPAIERYEGVLDANMWIGFSWADEPRNAAAVLVTGWDRADVVACARELATEYWAAHEGFQIVADHYGTWEEALDFALADVPRPTYLSDSGDNVSAGGSGDLTFALQQTRARADVAASGLEFLFAGLVDPDTFDAALAAGVGATLERAVGATVDDRFAGPVPGRWTVERFIDGVYGEDRPVAAVLRDGRISISVQWARRYFVSTSDPAFAGYPMPGLAWFDPAGYDVVVVKNGYLFTGQALAAASAFMAITPGGTDLDVDRLHYDRVTRPIWPLDDGFDPDLEPVLLPAPVSTSL